MENALAGKRVLITRANAFMGPVLCEVFAEQGAEVVVITDPWISPAANHARYRFSAQIEVPSAWDSTVALQVLVETMMAAVQSLTWEETSARMERLEGLYARSKFFRRR